jgi:hypothetical protein
MGIKDFNGANCSHSASKKKIPYTLNLGLLGSMKCTMLGLGVNKESCPISFSCVYLPRLTIEYVYI